MAKKGYTPEQIINKLREAEIILSQGEEEMAQPAGSENSLY